MREIDFWMLRLKWGFDLGLGFDKKCEAKEKKKKKKK